MFRAMWTSFYLYIYFISIFIYIYFFFIFFFLFSFFERILYRHLTTLTCSKSVYSQRHWEHHVCHLLYNGKLDNNLLVGNCDGCIFWHSVCTIKQNGSFYCTYTLDRIKYTFQDQQFHSDINILSIHQKIKQIKCPTPPPPHLIQRIDFMKLEML